MTYNTPELLTVGAAQNLVLGELEKNPGATNFDDIPEEYTTHGPVDSASW